MLTFQDQYQMAQDITGDSDSSRLAILKRDINEGGAMFLNRLGRKFNKRFKTANLVADRQYYQLPMDVIRIAKARVLHGTFWYVPQLVTSEEEWDRLNAIETTGNYPTHYFIRGFNEVGLWPIPSSSLSNALEISFEPQHVTLSQDDYTTGTVTVAKDSVTLTHSATGFTPQMVGRWVQINDGSDGKWYRIASYTSSSVLSLENYYEGVSGSGRTFRIGEVMQLPQGYHDAPVFYALDLYYLGKQDKASADDFRRRFDAKVKSARATYGRSTSNYGTKSRSSGRRASWIDLTPPVIYP